MWNYCKYLLLCLLILFCSCNQGKTQIYAKPLPEAVNTVSNRILGEPKNGVILIKDTIDLGNRICKIPQGVELYFKGGIVQNGALEGSMSRIRSSKACFNRIKILGTWNVPVIKTNLFCDLNYDNSLRDVVALSDPSIKNTIIIEEGQYQVTAYRNGDICIPISSNTDLVLNGEVRISPNPYTNYYIIQVSGENIKIHGRGSIIGDKHTHTGDKGEWGMGINFDNAHHVSISGLSIKNCWGDCIYIGNESTDISIRNCSLDHGRRQGLSVSSVDGLVVKNCIITNVSGTAPEYGIDIEPNTNEHIDHVKIENVTISNCEGGIQAWGRAPGASIGAIEIKKCIISGCSNKMPIKIVKCSSAKVIKCITKGFSWKEDISFFDVDNVINKNNKKQL